MDDIKNGIVSKPHRVYDWTAAEAAAWDKARPRSPGLSYGTAYEDVETLTQGGIEGTLCRAPYWDGREWDWDYSWHCEGISNDCFGTLAFARSDLIERLAYEAELTAREAA